MFAAISPLKSLSKKLIRGGITNIKIPIFKNIVNITTITTVNIVTIILLLSHRGFQHQFP